MKLGDDAPHAPEQAASPPGAGPGEPGLPDPDIGPLRDAPPEDLQREQRWRLIEVWKTPSGLRYWSSVNNSDVGVWYVSACFIFFLFAGVLALVMRAQLAVPNAGVVSADTYNQMFTVHGSVMMFLFAIPIFEAIAVVVLPQMLGARDLPFPRLSAFGFWCFVLGGLFLCGSIFFNAAPSGGWFMYPPLTSAFTPGIGPDIWLLGFSFIEVAAIAAAVELIVGVLKCRPPGMRIHMMPLYAWYVLVAAVMIVFAFPPLIAGSLLLELERAFAWPFFDPARGGDPLLWQHLFWLFGHPEVYIIFLPSVALVAMIVPTFARRAIVGYGWVVLAAVGTGFLSFGLWVHHMYTTGLPGISLGLFSAASMAVSIPTGVQFACFIATLLAGRVTRSLPLLWILGALAIFVLGGLTGVMVALAPFDFQVHDTFFVVAHFHYALIGGAIFPVMAGVYYFHPMVQGKLLSERLGKVAFWLAFVGFNITFMPMHFTGMRGMPRRVFTYPAGLGFEELNMVSTVGAVILAAGILVVVFDVVRPKPKSAVSPRDPWGAGTLEWVQEMPGQPWGIRSIPEIDSRYPLWDQPNLMRDIDEGRFFLPDAEEMRRETIVTSVIDATPLHCQRLPGSSFLPLLAALTTGGFFIFGTYHLWTLAIASLAAALAVIVRWLWTGTALIPEKASKHVGLGQVLPLYVSGRGGIGYWAMFITMLADVTAFISIVFGYFYFWTIHEDFPPRGVVGPGVLWPALGAATVAAAWALTWYAWRSNRLDRARAFYVSLSAGVVLALAGAAALLVGPWQSGLAPASHAYPATVWLMLIWASLHVVFGVIMQLYCLARRFAGRMTARHDIDATNVLLYWHFALFMVVVGVLVGAGFPLVGEAGAW
jgi:cytochrome c oxidase subunit I+III